ncbi:MAG: type II secretion system protein GspN [Desulfocapsaceae bacterium]|nr:type II secretion system protein GspN [Desulfocapsaceae bacterium]
MIFSQNTFRRWSLYGIYALLLVAILLYFRFPTQKFKIFCTQKVSQYLSGNECSIESLRYQFPLTLVANNLRLHVNNQAGKGSFSAGAIPGASGTGPDKQSEAKTPALAEVLELPKVTLAPILSGLGKTFSISITAYGGTHWATLACDRAHNTFTLSKIEIKGLDLAKLPWLRAQTGRAITGLLTVEGSYSGQSGQGLSRGTGQGTAQIKKGTFDLLYPIFSLKNIDVESGEVLIKLQEQKLLLTKGKFSGKELAGTFAGQVDSLGANFAAMQLNMTGSLAPTPALVKKSGQAQPLLQQLQKHHSTLPFHLQGTIGNPVFRFDS